MSSSSLTALPSAAVVEGTLLRETERAIVLRFGRAADPLTRRADAQLRGVAQRSDELLEIFTVDLDEIAEAYRYIETGQKTGNVALRMS